jgi:hypothetical protein
MGLREGRRVRDGEGGSKTSEKCCLCLCGFCEKPFQSGPNGIQAHHGVQRTEKKQTAKLCKSTRRTSKQDVNRRCPARCEASSRRRPRKRYELCARKKPSGAGVADDGERCTLLSRRHLPNRAPQLRLGMSRTWQPTLNKLRSKVLLTSRSPFPNST